MLDVSTQRKVIIFENITLSNYWRMRWHIAQGHVVKVFDWDFKTKAKEYLRPYVDNNSLGRIYINSHSIAHGQAIDLAQRLLGYVQKTILYRLASKLYSSEDVSFIFRRALAEDIFKFCYIHDYLTGFAVQDPKISISFIPQHYRRLQRFLNKEAGLNKGLPVNVTLLANPLSFAGEIVQKIIFKSAVKMYVLKQWLACVFAVMAFRGKVSQEKFDYAVLVGSRLEVERAGDRGYDFLLNEPGPLNNDNTIFLDQSGLSPALLKEQKAKGRRFFQIKKSLTFSSLAGHRRDMRFLREIINAWVPSSFSFSGPSSLWRAFFFCVQKYGDWNVILQEIDFKKIIFTNQEHMQMSTINLFLRQKGIESWHYSCYFAAGYIWPKDKDIRHTLWSFLIYDHFVGFNKDIIDYHNLHYQSVKTYHAVGSLYGQLIKDKISDQGRKELWQQCFKVQDATGKAMIAVFDTSFIDEPDCDTSLDDGLVFYKDFMRFIDEHPHCYIIFKPSKSPTFYAHPDFPASSAKGKCMVDVWKELKNHPRVFWPIDQSLTPKSFLDFSWNNRLMAGADVVITHCMSSPTAEALGAGKKAFWYEAGQKHTAISYGRIPGLVVHGYDHLKKRIGALLNQSTADYDVYLNENIKGKIDPYIDGRAIIRFKEMLKA